MALDENLKNVPLTGNFATRPTGEVYLTGLVANPDLALSSNNNVTDVTPESGAEASVEEGTNIYSVALFDTSGALVKSTRVLYDNASQNLHAPSITSYATDSLNVSGNLTVSKNTDVSGTLTARSTTILSGNTTILGNLTVSGDSTLSSIMIDVSALSSLWVSGDNHIKGDLNVTGNTFLSGNADVSGDLFVKDDLSVLDAANVCSVFTAHNVVSALSGLNVSGDVSVQSTSRDLALFSGIETASATLGVASTSTSAIITASSTNTAITNTAAGNIHFLTNNAYVMTLENGGKVGVGTTDPGQAIDVVGTAADTQVSVRVDNQDGGAASDARLILKVASTGGDAYVRMFENGGNSWCMGAYTQGSPGTNFRITDHTNLDSNVAIEIDASQDIWMPKSLAVGQSATAASYVVLECDSTTEAFLPPRMTTTQRDAIGGGIADPATGSVIYNTTTNVLNFFNGSAWGAV